MKKSFLSIILIAVLTISAVAFAACDKPAAANFDVVSKDIVLQLGKTDSRQIAVIGVPDDDFVVYESKNTDIAVCSAGGNVTAIAEGSTDVIVSLKYAKKSITVHVTVYPHEISPDEDFTVTSSKSLTLEIESTSQITVIGVPEGDFVVYKSSNVAIATCSDSGLITAVGVGSTTVNVKLNSTGKNYYIYVTVKEYVPPVEVKFDVVSSKSLSFMLGKTEESQILTKGVPEGDKVIYESSDEEVAVVSESGLITAQQIGTASITVSLESTGESKTVSLSVSGSPSITDFYKNIDRINTFGRTFTVSGGKLALYNTATGFEVSFYGSQLTMTYAAGGIRTLELGVYVDGRLHSTISPENTETDSKMVICSKLTRGLHKVKVLKMTEAYANQMTITKLECDEFFKKPPVNDYKRISFYGDSITAGCNNLLEGTEAAYKAEHLGADNPFDQLENGLKSYATIACKKLNAIADIHARTGIGIVNGYGSINQSEVYKKNFCGENDFLNIGQKNYRMESLAPDAIVINLGTNDYWKKAATLAEIKEGLKQLFYNLTETHGATVPVFFVEGGMITNLNGIYAEIVEELSQEGYSVYHFTMTTCASGAHPKVADHELNGEALATFIQETLGW